MDNFVSIDLEKLRNKELNIFKQFIRICNKYNLKWFAVGGTCLGAVRHNGFIPWDDDIDVALPRLDYERFLDVAQKELDSNLFLQTHLTDKDYRNDYAKIRDSSTTFIETLSSKLRINHGVYIDVFPIDGLPKNDKDKKKLDRHKKIAKFYLEKDYVQKDRDGKSSLIKFVMKCFGFISPRWVIKNLEKHYKKFEYDSSVLVGCHGGVYGDSEFCPKEYYGNGVECDFENIKIIVPELTDKYLTKKYGNYMELPPEEKRYAHHFVDKVDLYNSYKAYINIKNKTVITYGTFDLLHYGHINLMERAKQFGSKLIVGVSSEECCKNKGKLPVYSLEKRMKMVSYLKIVDKVIIENDMKQKVEDIKKYKVNVFVLGDDYIDAFKQMEEYEKIKDKVEVVFLPRTPNISTSQLKKDLNN